MDHVTGQIIDHLLAVQLLAKSLDPPRRALIAKGLITIIEGVLPDRERPYKALPSGQVTPIVEELPAV